MFRGKYFFHLSQRYHIKCTLVKNFQQRRPNSGSSAFGSFRHWNFSESNVISCEWHCDLNLISDDTLASIITNIFWTMLHTTFDIIEFNKNEIRPTMKPTD